ncbi:MAG: metallophosphoesterase [Magnetococcales bacterium]|nr:metallophosphoesterase [Magnetococcales bacterium]
MIIGLISDSHDHIDHLRQALAVFQAQHVNLVVHAGDMISPGVMHVFRGMNVAAVFGNNDGEKYGLLRLFDDHGWRLQGEFLELEVSEKHMAVYHGTVPAMRDALIASGRFHYVVYGHTHRPENKYFGSTLALNPGTAHGFGTQATVMVLDTNQDKVNLIHLE